MDKLSSPNLQGFLDRLTRRSILTPEEQQAVLELPGRVEQVQANRDFVPQGERVDQASLVVAGFIGRFDQNGEGKRQITAVHVPGDICDLHSVVLPVATSALQALSVSTIIRIPHVAIRSVAAHYPAISEALWRDCMVNGAILSEWVVNVGRRDAKTRMAHLFCEMATRLGAADGQSDVVFDLPVTQDHIASATALTTVHVNRTLRSLRSGGLLEWHSRVARIPSWHALASLGEFNPSYLQMEIKADQRMRIVDAG